MIVEIVGAYVDGLPIPNSSSFLTKVASVNLKGYFVKDCVTVTDSLETSSPTRRFGNNPLPFSSSLSFDSMYNFKKPSNLTTSPSD